MIIKTVKHTIHIIVAIFHFSFIFANENQFYFNHIHTEMGLPSNSIKCFFQDNKGFIWLGTNNGLSKYDAYSFKTWKYSPFKASGLSNNIVNCIEQDYNGNLLVGTNNGLSIFNFQEDSFRYLLALPPNSAKKKIIVTSLAETEEGFIFIGTSQGIFLYDPHNHSGEQLIKLKDPRFQIGYVRDIAEIPGQNKIWIASVAGIHVYDFRGREYEKITIKAFDPFTTQRLLYDKRRKNIYIGTLSEGVFKYNLTNQEVTPFRRIHTKSGTENRVFAMSLDTSNNIWVSIGHYLLMYESPGSSPITIESDPENPFSRSEGIINSIFCDRNNLLWLANYQIGIDLLDRTKLDFKSFFIETGKDARGKNYVTSFCMDHSEKFWIGSFGNGLKVFNSNLERQNIPRFIEQHLPSQSIKAILHDHESDILWIGTLEGIARYNLKKNQVENTNNINKQLPHEIIINLFKDSQQNLWIATQAGLSLYNMQQDTIINFTREQGLCHYQISGIAEDNNDNIWISTFQGVSKYSLKNKQFTNYLQSENPMKGLSDNHVTCIKIDLEGIVWMGTNNGLTRYDPMKDEFKWFFQEDGLIGNGILDIQVNGNNKLYILGNNGLSIYDQSSKTFTNFLLSEGLKTNNASYLHEKILYIGGRLDGFYAIPVEKLNQQFNKVPVFITRISSATRDEILFHDKDKVKIKHEDKFIKINYTALNYSSPEKTNFEYKMVGFDDEWIKSNYTIRQVTYNNLPPGDYEFIVKAITNKSKGSTSESIKIKVLPPIWISLPAKISYFILILVLIFAYRKFINYKNSLEHKVKIEKNKSQLQHEKDLAVQNVFANISHEFRNPLSLISAPVEELLNDPTLSKEQMVHLQIASNNIMRLNSLVDMVLDYNRLGSNLTELKPTGIDLIGYVKEIFNMFSYPMQIKNISRTFKANREKLKCAIDTVILEKIVFNLLSNALKNTPKNGEIRLSVHYDESKQIISINVVNTGKGIQENELTKIFERYVQASTNSNHLRGSGLGLYLVKEYLELMKGNISVKSVPNKHTCFSINLPFSPVDDKEEVLTGEIEDRNNHYFIEKTNDLEYYNNEKKEGDAVKTPENEKIIAIIEDEDEIRHIIKNALQKKFHVIEAPDGKAGLELILSKIPDLIISDIMMPNMNGIELCNKVKTNELTSHIPLVMLTARKAMESELISYETGADMYLTKPFSISMLLIIINNLIENRDRVKSLYAKDNYANISRLYENRTDKFFMDKINQVIEENLISETFNVNSLATILNMSNANLHRKCIGLLGTSPGEYIRVFRLNTAFKMIKETNMSIAEIAFSTGFKYHSHFSKSFQKHFGILPSDYKK